MNYTYTCTLTDTITHYNEKVLNIRQVCLWEKLVDSLYSLIYICTIAYSQFEILQSLGHINCAI